MLHARHVHVLRAFVCTQTNLPPLSPFLPSSHRGTQAAKFYVVSMKRIADRGDTYVADETLRLQRMIESGSVKATKVDEFTKRVNVLAAFKN